MGIGNIHLLVVAVMVKCIPLVKDVLPHLNLVLCQGVSLWQGSHIRLSSAVFHCNVSDQHSYCLVVLHNLGDPVAVCLDALQLNRGHLVVADLVAGLELVVLVAGLAGV